MVEAMVAEIAVALALTMAMNTLTSACQAVRCGPPAMWVPTHQKATATTLHGARHTQRPPTIGVLTNIAMVIVTS